jgi:hypothetical protein
MLNRILLLGTAALLCGAVPHSAWAVDFYVAPNGNDSWSGALQKPDSTQTDGPFATLAQAVRASRDWKKGNPSQSARILLDSGTYWLDSTLDLFAVDSGLTIAASPGERPVLSGGRRIGGWKKSSGSLWEAPLPEAKTGGWDFRILTINGEWRPRARLPEKGTFTHLSRFEVRWMSSTGGGWQVQPTREQLTQLQYNPDDLGRWLNLDNAEVSVYHMWDMSLMKPVANDRATHTLTFAYPGEHPPGAFGINDYIVWNIPEGLKEPGQWYLDRAQGRLVYWPKEGEDMARAEVLAPTTANLIRISGYKDMPVSDVTLEGLSFTLANAPLVKGGFGALDLQGALSLSHTKDCRLSHLHLFQTAGYGIQATGSDGLQVRDCLIEETGAGGIRAEGNGIILSGNRVRKVGLVYPSGIAMDVGGGKGARILHNSIQDCTYDGILNGAGESLIEKNRIYLVMQELHDGGAIYSGFCQGVTIRGNWASNITNMGGYGSSAYYLDEQSAGCLVEDNLSVNVTRPSQNHMAHDNVLRHNLFIITGDGMLNFARCKGYSLEGNVIEGDGKINFTAPPDGVTSTPRNVIDSAKGDITWQTLADYNVQNTEPFAPKDGTVVADPLLVNKKPGAYEFGAGSPALKLGIKPIDNSDAGSDSGL